MNGIKERLLVPMFLTASAAVMLGWLSLLGWSTWRLLF